MAEESMGVDDDVKKEPPDEDEEALCDSTWKGLAREDFEDEVYVTAHSSADDDTKLVEQEQCIKELNGNAEEDFAHEGVEDTMNPIAMSSSADELKIEGEEVNEVKIEDELMQECAKYEEDGEANTEGPITATATAKIEEIPLDYFGVNGFPSTSTSRAPVDDGSGCGVCGKAMLNSALPEHYKTVHGSVCEMCMVCGAYLLSTETHNHSQNAHCVDYSSVDYTLVTFEHTKTCAKCFVRSVPAKKHVCVATERLREVNRLREVFPVKHEKLMQDALCVLCRIPFPDAYEMSDHLHTAHKGIVMKRKLVQGFDFAVRNIFQCSQCWAGFPTAHHLGEHFYKKGSLDPTDEKFCNGTMVIQCNEILMDLAQALGLMPINDAMFQPRTRRVRTRRFKCSICGRMGDENWYLTHVHPTLLPSGRAPSARIVKKEPAPTATPIATRPVLMRMPKLKKNQEREEAARKRELRMRRRNKNKKKPIKKEKKSEHECLGCEERPQRGKDVRKEKKLKEEPEVKPESITVNQEYHMPKYDTSKHELCLFCKEWVLIEELQMHREERHANIHQMLPVRQCRYCYRVKMLSQEALLEHESQCPVREYYEDKPHEDAADVEKAEKALLEPCACPICRDTCKTAFELSKHLFRWHKTRLPFFQCTKCKKSFSAPWIKQLHHVMEGQPQCNGCCVILTFREAKFEKQRYPEDETLIIDPMDEHEAMMLNVAAKIRTSCSNFAQASAALAAEQSGAQNHLETHNYVETRFF